MSDKLLTVEQAAEMLNVSTDWLYRDKRWKTLPFTVVLSKRKIRFSMKGIERYIEEAMNGRKNISERGDVLDRI